MKTPSTNQAEPMRVGIVEDEPAVLGRLVNAVASSATLQLVGTATTAHEGVKLVRAAKPDVVLVDLGLPDGTGLDVIRVARHELPSCDAMVITMFADEDHVLRAIEAGAIGYLLKDGTENDLAQHLDHLRAGGSPISPMIARQLHKRWGMVAPETTKPSLRERVSAPHEAS